MEGIRFVVDERGRRTAVQIDLEEHSELWEDFHDLLLARAREDEPRESFAEGFGVSTPPFSTRTGSIPPEPPDPPAHWRAGPARGGRRTRPMKEQNPTELAAGGAVLLGGRAPVWAYCAALHRALDRDPAAVVGVFDPKLPGAQIVIPASRPSAASPLAGKVEAEWRDASATGPATLDLRVATPDRMLDPPKLDHLPPPPGPPPRGDVVVSGAVPIWLHLAYTRWLRTVEGVHRIGAWDARTRAPVWVGRGSGV